MAQRKSKAPDFTQFGQRLAWALQGFKDMESGTQRHLAIQCQKKPGAVSKWFSGDVSDMDSRNLFKVADLCNVDARWLSTGDGDPRGTGIRNSAGVEEIRLSPAEQALLGTFRQLPPDTQGALLRFLRTIIVNA